MPASSQIPLEELEQAAAKILSLMQDTHTVIMHAQSANDAIMHPTIFSGAGALASQAKSAEITQAGQQVINSCTALGDNLGIARSHWGQQAADAAQLITSTVDTGIHSA